MAARRRLLAASGGAGSRTSWPGRRRRVFAPGDLPLLRRAVRRVKRGFLRFLIQAKEEGRSIAAYGAPAKGNTLLNYCGVRTDFLDFTVDRSPHKQGRSCRAPAFPSTDRTACARRGPTSSSFCRNLKEEIMEQMADFAPGAGLAEDHARTFPPNDHTKRPAPGANVRHLLHDLFFQVPRQNEDEVGPRLAQASGPWMGTRVPGRKRPCLWGLRSTVKSRKSVRTPHN